MTATAIRAPGRFAGGGVEVVSISGAKGKRITSAQEWNRPDYRVARANRSAVESLMFTLKEGYEFGQLLRGRTRTCGPN